MCQVVSAFRLSLRAVWQVRERNVLWEGEDRVRERVGVWLLLFPVDVVVVGLETEWDGDGAVSVDWWVVSSGVVRGLNDLVIMLYCTMI